MQDNQNRNSFHYIGAIIAVVFLTIALLLHISFDNYLDKMDADEIKAALGKNPLWTKYFWSSLLKEIAFALIIAIFIALGIERAAKYKQVQEVKEYLDDVTENVFSAILKKNVPDEIVDSVFQNIYAGQFLRRNSRITIRLLDFPNECEDADDFLIYQVIHHYEVHSLVNREIEYDLHIYGPEPHLEGLREHIPKITVRINGQTLTSQTIDEGEEAIPNSGFEERFKTVYPIPPKGALNVSTTHSIAKKKDDSELWVTIMPQIGMELTVENSTALELFWDVDSLFFGDLSPTTPGLEDAPYTNRRASFAAKQAILPYQGVNINWRPQRGGATPDCG